MSNIDYLEQFEYNTLEIRETINEKTVNTKKYIPMEQETYKLIFFVCFLFCIRKEIMNHKICYIKAKDELDVHLFYSTSTCSTP